MAAAESDEAEELLSDAPPWCYSEDGEIKKCSPIADTAIRAGIYELEVRLHTQTRPHHASPHTHPPCPARPCQEWIRPDRYYCASRLFRDLVLEDGSVGEAECRANISARNATCNNEVCEQCTSQCTYRSAKAAAGVVKCTVARDQLGFNHCLQTTDAGQLARASHGAIRGENYIAVHTASNTMINHTPQFSDFFVSTGPREAGRARLPHLPQQSQGLCAARFHFLQKGGAQLAHGPIHARIQPEDGEPGLARGIHSALPAQL